MPPIQTLLLTGTNNHDWKRTAPYLHRLLENSGLFQVNLAENASQALEADLNGIDLFFLDYNGPLWSDKAQTNFLRAVQSGAGVCVLHAANNAFEGWVEYEKLVGLLWREGSGHGQFHEFEVKITAPDHPINQGLADFRTEDELYHRLVPTRGSSYEVLATAYSSPTQGGSGQNEPMLITTTYGMGRVFHTALGHVWPDGSDSTYRGATMVAVENEGFQRTLLRGCQWAATGDVTL